MDKCNTVTGKHGKDVRNTKEQQSKQGEQLKKNTRLGLGAGRCSSIIVLSKRETACSTNRLEKSMQKQRIGSWDTHSVHRREDGLTILNMRIT